MHHRFARPTLLSLVLGATLQSMTFAQQQEAAAVIGHRVTGN